MYVGTAMQWAYFGDDERTRRSTSKVRRVVLFLTRRVPLTYYNNIITILYYNIL
jgi:hypothetical protein